MFKRLFLITLLSISMDTYAEEIGIECQVVESNLSFMFGVTFWYLIDREKETVTETSSQQQWSTLRELEMENVRMTDKNIFWGSDLYGRFVLNRQTLDLLYRIGGEFSHGGITYKLNCLSFSKDELIERRKQFFLARIDKQKL